MSEMELLITITTALLLAIAFLAPYEIKKDIDAPNPFIIELFIIGIFVIFFAFLAIIFPETSIKGFNPFKVGAYILAILFFIFFLNLFLNRYGESISFKSGIETANTLEAFIKIRMKTFFGGTFILTFLGTLILVLLALITKLIFSH